LFAFASDEAVGFSSLTRNSLLARCNEVWSACGLGKCSGHSFRIGGTTELLKLGVSHDAVKVQGRWSSDAWLLYIRHHPEILEMEYNKAKLSRASVLF
ncbi:hypothetical protein DL93DRAFT_2065117, partial [Clavulina sp. PMI_390]